MVKYILNIKANYKAEIPKQDYEKMSNEQLEKEMAEVKQSVVDMFIENVKEATVDVEVSIIEEE